MLRIKAIDSIRYLAAMVVVLGHYGLPRFNLLVLNNNFLGEIIHGIMGCLFNGPAAVIVFFIISGFCIHFPYRENRSLSLFSYYSKRIIRICIPAIIAILIYKFLGIELEAPTYGVFWSIICELIYYIIYPIILYVRDKVSWRTIISSSYIISILIIIVNLNKLGASYVSLGAFTWIIGLPCWLLGCWLSENYLNFQTISTKRIWLMRLFIFLVSIVLRVIKFHVNSLLASNVITLNIFAFLIVMWLGFEIVYFQKRNPVTILEWAGKWSYSLYIIHPIIPTLIALTDLSAPHYSIIFKSLCLSTALVFSYIFYLLIEKPSHKLAIYVSKHLKSKSLLSIIR